MPEIFPGRWSADIEGDFVVFLIGMRVNRPWKLRKVAFMLGTMPKLLKELDADPVARLPGELAGAALADRADGDPVLALVRGARGLRRRADATRTCGSASSSSCRLDGDIGIWHETFKVRAGEYESVYGGMPRFGLAAAAGHRPLGSASRARERIGAHV